MKSFKTNLIQSCFEPTYTSTCFEGRCGSSLPGGTTHFEIPLEFLDTDKSMCIVNCITLTFTIADVTSDSWRSCCCYYDASLWQRLTSYCRKCSAARGLHLFAEDGLCVREPSVVQCLR